MSKSLPTFLSRKLHEKNLDLLAVIHELNDVFTEAGYPLELDRLSTVTWVNIPKSHGVHGMCWLMESGDVSIFVDERFKGEGMWYELRRLVAHECVHFVQYQAFSESQDGFYLDEYVGKGGRGLGYLKGHAEFFHDVAAEVNSLEPSLNITPLHVGFGDDSTLANKTLVAVVDYQREVWPLGKEHSELKSFEAAFAGKVLDEGSLLNSIYEKYGSAATFLRVFETLSPVAESLPSLSSSSSIKGTSSYLGDFSSLISKIKSHSTTEVISERAIRASRGKRLELAVVDVEANGGDGAQVVFYSTEPLDVYKVLLEVVPFFGGKVSGVSHYLTENLSAEKSHKLTKGGAIRKNQKFTGHREDFVKGLIEHPSSKLIAEIGEAEICARFIEKGFDSKTTSLDKANHSFNLVKHVVKHLKSFPVIGDKVLSKDAAKRIAEVITKESQHIPKALQERIMGGWEALNIKDFPELTLELSFALDGYSVGESDLSEVFRALDNLHYRFGDYRHNSNKDFVEDAVKAAGFKGSIPVDFYNWEPDMEWLGEKIAVENQSRINGAVNAGWGERDLVEDMFNIEASLRFIDHCEEASLKFEDLLSSVVNGGASPDVTSERRLNSQTPQMSLGF